MFQANKDIPEIIGTAIPRRQQAEDTRGQATVKRTMSAKDRTMGPREDSDGRKEQPKVASSGRREQTREASGGSGGRREQTREASGGRREQPRDASGGRREQPKETSPGKNGQPRETSRRAPSSETSRGRGDLNREVAGRGCWPPVPARSSRDEGDLRVSQAEVAERLAARKEVERLEAEQRLGAEQRRSLRTQADQKRLGVKELKVRLLFTQ